MHKGVHIEKASEAAVSVRLHKEINQWLRSEAQNAQPRVSKRPYTRPTLTPITPTEAAMRLMGVEP